MSAHSTKWTLHLKHQWLICDLQVSTMKQVQYHKIYNHIPLYLHMQASSDSRSSHHERAIQRIYMTSPREAL